MSNNYVRITSNDGQEVICKNFSQLFECLTAVNEKLLPDKFKVQICEDDKKYIGHFSYNGRFWREKYPYPHLEKEYNL